MFENKTYNGIYYTRYWASFTKAAAECGRPFSAWEFYKWLKYIGVNNSEAVEMRNLAMNGKMELEDLARTYLKSEES